MSIFSSINLSRKQILLAFSVAFFILAFFILVFDWYPVAFVNGEPLFASRFSRNYEAANLYYQNALKTYASPENRPPEISREEFQAGVLSQLVEAIIVDHAARGEVGKDLDYLVGSKVDQYLEDDSLEEAARTLYGLTREEFAREVLIPQAKRDILAGRLFLDGKALDDWLAAKRKEARVRILSGKFEWNGSEVLPKK